jgi:hypothetical protein
MHYGQVTYSGGRIGHIHYAGATKLSASNTTTNQSGVSRRVSRPGQIELDLRWAMLDKRCAARWRTR